MFGIQLFLEFIPLFARVELSVAELNMFVLYWKISYIFIYSNSNFFYHVILQFVIERLSYHLLPRDLSFAFLGVIKSSEHFTKDLMHTAYRFWGTMLNCWQENKHGINNQAPNCSKGSLHKVLISFAHFE